MWAFHGELDNVIPLSDAQSVINTLIRCGGNPNFTTYPNLYHDCWTTTYANPAIYTWLLTKKKQ
jgi:predicted peptidase